MGRFKLSTLQIIATSLALAGYLCGQYGYIPDFEFNGFTVMGYNFLHFNFVQVPDSTREKLVAFNMFVDKVAIFLLVMGSRFGLIASLFLVWTFANNFMDEIRNKNFIFGDKEQGALILTLLIIGTLIWKRKFINKNGLAE